MLRWFLTIALLCVLVLAVAPRFGLSSSADAILVVVVGFVFTLVHGSVMLGWRNIIAFILITYALSFTVEAVGVATGFVFGPYHYSEYLGTRIFGVPPVIQLAYVSMGYASMMMARLILGVARPLGWWLVAAAIAGAFLMVGWDVAIDPYMSTVSGFWIWHQGGAYFGVPLQNYAGWFATVLIFMVAYYLFAQRWRERPQQSAMVNTRLFWSMPAIYYGLMALNFILKPFVGDFTKPMASPENYAGSLTTLAGALTVIAIFVMGTPVALALLRRNPAPPDAA